MSTDQATTSEPTVVERLAAAEQERDEALATLRAFEDAIGRAGRMWRTGDGRLFLLDGESDLEPTDFLPEGAVELVPAKTVDLVVESDPERSAWRHHCSSVGAGALNAGPWSAGAACWSCSTSVNHAEDVESFGLVTVPTGEAS